MKILRDAGSFEILTPEATLRQQLLIIEQAGRTCYQSFRGEVTQKSAEKFVRMILSRNPPHESVIEHGWMTVRFAECSRGFTHELVRHRLASFSQESTRYVDYARRGGKVDLKRFQVQFVMPPHRRDEPVPRDDGRDDDPNADGRGDGAILPGVESGWVVSPRRTAVSAHRAEGGNRHVGQL